MILINIIIMHAYFVISRVYSIESSDDVNISKYTVDMYLYKTVGNPLPYKEYINVNFEKRNITGIEVPTNQLIRIIIQSDKGIYIKELIIVFDKIQILHNSMRIKCSFGKTNFFCDEYYRIKRLQSIYIIYTYIIYTLYNNITNIYIKWIVIMTVYNIYILLI